MYRKQANQLKKGDYLLFKQKVWKILMQPKHVKGGKHGPGKEVFDARSVFDGKKTKMAFESKGRVTIPDLKFMKFEVTNFDDLWITGFRGEEDEERRDYLKIKDQNVSQRIEELLEEDDEDVKIVAVIAEHKKDKIVTEIRTEKYG